MELNHLEIFSCPQIIENSRQLCLSKQIFNRKYSLGIPVLWPKGSYSHLMELAAILFVTLITGCLIEDLRIERVLLVPYFYLIDFFFIQQLAQKCDILVENYLPGKLDKFGLGYDSLKTSVPSLIYCSITGYGTGGPYEQQPGYDVVVSGIGRLTHITGPEVHRTRTLNILGSENLVPRVLSLP